MTHRTLRQAHDRLLLEEFCSSSSEGQTPSPEDQSALDILKQSGRDYFCESGSNTSQLNAVNGSLVFFARANLPAHAIIDRGHFYNVLADYHSLFPQSLPLLGEFKIKDGKIQLPRGETLVEFKEPLRIYPNGNPEHLLPNIEGRSLEINDEGVPELQLYDAFTGVPVPPQRALDAFAQQMPIGQTPEGKPVFDEDRMKPEDQILPLALLLRLQNLPEELPLAPLMIHALSTQKLNPPMRPDPELDLNLPLDPLKIIRELYLGGSFSLPAELVLPGQGNLPGVVIGQKEGSTVGLKAEITNFGAPDERGAASLAAFLEVQGKCWDDLPQVALDRYNWVTFSDGNKTVTLPINAINPFADILPSITDQLDAWTSATTVEEQKKEIWERLKKDGYINRDGDLRTRACQDGKITVRLSQDPPLSSFNVKLDVDNHELYFVKPDGNEKISLPLTTNLMLALSGEGPHNSLSLKDWALHLKTNGFIAPRRDADGTGAKIHVPALTLGGQTLPGFLIPLHPTVQGLHADNFEVDFGSGGIKAKGELRGDIDASSVYFTPPLSFWEKVGLEGIPILDGIKGQFDLKGNGDSLSVEAQGQTSLARSLPLLADGITIEKLAVALKHFKANISQADDKITRATFSLETGIEAKASLKDGSFELAQGRFALDSGKALYNWAQGLLNVTTHWESSLQGKFDLPPLSDFLGTIAGSFLSKAQGTVNLSGPLTDLTLLLGGELMAEVKTSLGELVVSNTFTAMLKHLGSPDQRQMLSADLVFSGDLYDAKQDTRELGHFSGLLSLEDGDYRSAEGETYGRALTVATLEASLRGISKEGFKVSGRIESGPETVLKESDKTRERISRGITFFSEVTGQELVKQIAGPLAEAKLNLKLKRANINVAGVNLGISGHMVGRVKLVNVSQDPLKPDFKPRPGFTFEVRNADITVDVSGKKTRITGLVRITERNGVVTVNSRHVIPGKDGGEAQTIFKNHLRITIDPKARKIFQRASSTPLSPPLAQSATPLDGQQTRQDATPSIYPAPETIPYYDPLAMNNIPMAFTLRVLDKNLEKIIVEGQKELVATGWARVKNAFTQPLFSFGGSLPLGERTLKLPAPALLNTEAKEEGALQAPPARQEIKLGRGGLEVKGNQNAITTTVTVPALHLQGLRVNLPDGSGYVDLDGEIKIPTKLAAEMNLRNWETQFSQEPLAVTSESLYATPFHPDGRPKGPRALVDINFKAEPELTAIPDKAGKKITYRITIPEHKFTAEVKEALCLGALNLSPDSRLDIPSFDMGGFVTVDLKKLSATGQWDFGRMTVDASAPGSPADKAKVSLKGPLKAHAEIQLPKMSFEADLKNGFQAHLINPDIIASLAVTIGKDLELKVSNAKIGKGALSAVLGEALSGNADPEINTRLGLDGTKTLDLSDLPLDATLEGFVNLQGSKLSLDGIVLKGFLEHARIHEVDTDGVKTLSLVIDQQSTLPATMPPADITEWLAWPAKNWTKYRKELNAPERRFLAVVTEPVTELPIPGVTFPPGSGKVYVSVGRTEFKVNVKDFKDKNEALVDLLNQANAALTQGMIREYPVPSPEQLKRYQETKGPDVIYNDQQNPEGTFFILGQGSTTQAVLSGLGLPSFVTGNKRIDLSDLTRSKVLGAYLKDSLPAVVQTLRNNLSPHFGDWETRALKTLGTINEKLPLMVEARAIYRNERVRTTVPINFDYEPTWGAFNDQANVVNLTSLTYMPQRPEDVQAILAETDRLKELLNWFPDQEKRPISVDINRSAPLPMTTFTAQADPEDPVMKQAAARFYVIPLTDGSGKKHSILVMDHALVLTGDYGFLEGRDRDFTKSADPLWLPTTTWLEENPPQDPVEEQAPEPVVESKDQAPCECDDAQPKCEKPAAKPSEAKKEDKEEAVKSLVEKIGINIARIPSMQKRAHPQGISDPAPVVSRGLMTDVINSIIHRAQKGQWVQAAPVYQKSDDPEGIKIPPEYLEIAFKQDKGADGQWNDYLTVKVNKETNLTFAKENLMKGFGLSESDAAELFPTGADAMDEKGYRRKQTRLRDIYEKSQLKEAMDYEEVVKLAKAVIEMPEFIHGRFGAHGSILMTMLKDLRKLSPQAKDGDYYFTNFNHPMFIGNYGPIDDQRSDLGANSMYFFIGTGTNEDVKKLAGAFGAPEKFKEYTPDYKAEGRGRISPEQEPPLEGVPEELKGYYDCAREGYYCNEAILDAGELLHHRIIVPNAPIEDYAAPWDMRLIPGKPLKENGMYSNSGQWLFPRLKDGRIVGANIRILNTRISNEEAVQKLAFDKMKAFLEGGVRKALGRTPDFNMKATFTYKS